MDHLTATSLEVLSVIAAKKQLKEPIKVPRPSEARQGQRQPDSRGGPPARDLDSAFKQGIGVLAASSKKVRQ